MNLLQLHDELTKRARALIEKKNHDYSSAKDPLSGITACEIIGVPPYKGVLVRMLDKVSRLSNVLDKNQNKVYNETVEDTVLDIINYAVLLLATQKPITKQEAQETSNSLSMWLDCRGTSNTSLYSPLPPREFHD